MFKLIELANCHPRVNVHTPGVGVGGHCIAVDPWFIHEKFEDITPLIYEARLVNDGKPAWTADRIARDVQPGAKIAVLGMSFKANIDDTRESPSVLFANILKERGYEVLACEPYIQGDVAGYHNYSLEEAMAQCDYAVITHYAQRLQGEQGPHRRQAVLRLCRPDGEIKKQRCRPASSPGGFFV
ncbi:MAG: UDP binding domain-containing protein [Acutalibacteraceae bacterium]